MADATDGNRLFDVTEVRLSFSAFILQVEKLQKANISKGTPTELGVFRLRRIGRFFGLILFVLWLWNETMTVMLRVHVVSFERSRGFSTISNKLLKSHRPLLYFCQKYSDRLQFDPVITMSPLFSYQLLLRNVVRMENCQNNNTVTHRMNSNNLTSTQRSRTFAEKQESCHLLEDTISIENKSAKSNSCSCGQDLWSAVKLNNRHCTFWATGDYPHNNLSGMPTLTVLLTNLAKSLWARETAGGVKWRLTWMTKGISTEQETKQMVH